MGIRIPSLSLKYVFYYDCIYSTFCLVFCSCLRCLDETFDRSDDSCDTKSMLYKDRHVVSLLLEPRSLLILKDDMYDKVTIRLFFVFVVKSLKCQLFPANSRTAIAGTDHLVCF